MTKKYEELVEEIGTEIGGYFNKAESIITHILSAVRDGRLDEELGVVSRIASLEKGLDVVNPMAALLNWFNQQIIAGADILIALSGTSQGDPVGGKEEE